MQEGSTDVWKENILEDLEGELLEYKNIREFLVDIRKEFGEEDEESVKVTELRRLEQERKTMKFIQEFRRAAKRSRYKERPLVKEFKRGINRMICQRLIEAEHQPSSIKQQYNRVIVLDRNWRKSRREEERLRRQRDNRVLAPRLNNEEAQQQQLPQPQTWLRRQKVPQQQVQTGPTPIEGVKKMNAVIVHSNQRVGLVQCNPYAMKVDRGNRNCYNCGRFRHLMRNYRNKGIENRKQNWRGKKTEIWTEIGNERE